MPKLTVDFPTPPLQEVTAMMRPILPKIGWVDLDISFIFRYFSCLKKENMQDRKFLDASFGVAKFRCQSGKVAVHSGCDA
jgi:hypothetical protein